ncbi:MAG: 16S rRNA (adenine(1518)-N(6)/adenine(1519)-N(6))-dimethyltransferase RsmA [bacterium]|nr:16S rRNA (adenine(1518)-N(6)/adenine(1519)-N(6))-dimethyltransferase RsmA [bacterium]
MFLYLEAKNLLKKNNLILRKRWGQNFLIDSLVYDKIIQSAKLSLNDHVLEIGAGLGFLTRLLAPKVSKVFTVEIDKKLVFLLQEQLSDFKNVEIINQDILKVDLKKLLNNYQEIKKVKVVANIPYYITSPIIFKLLEYRDIISDITMLTQKEVGERIIAAPGRKDYGILSIMVQYYAFAKKAMLVENSSFFPIPKVDSMLINLRILDKPKVSIENEKFFFNLVKTLFHQRRKMIANNLKSYSYNRQVLAKLFNELKIDPKVRAEMLSIEEIAKLSNSLYKLASSN